ncbi:O-methylsterigmatocystin oxidoreductase [Xylaria curta]|nr:O-methylsterigmatocystin oxidoreductase [Xylaria curta]
MLMFPSLLGLCICAVLLVFRSSLTSEVNRIRKGLRRVPGPWGLPIVGNLLQLSKRPQNELGNWALKYGELFQIKLGLTTWVYVNSPEAAREIMDKQSAHTSSRLPSPVANDLVGGDMRFVLMPDNPKWSFWRRTTQRLLTPSVCMTYLENQNLEAKQLVYDYLTDNKNQSEFYSHTRRFATSIIMATTYGWRLPTAHGEDIKQIYHILHALSEDSVPGAHIADALPFLARLPPALQWWRRKGLEHFQYQVDAWMGYWKRLQKRVETEESPHCFGKQLIAESPLNELEQGFLAGSLVEAGAETTSTTINSCLRYLANNPEAQAAAHAELDAVVGRERSPTWADQGSLPYIEACHRETSRLRPPSNNGVLHYTTKDLEYKGFHIPKGVVVAMNQYHMYYDPERYPDPEQFRPERFLRTAGPKHVGGAPQWSYNAEAGDLPDRWVFGAGRRLCPGMHFAVNSLYIGLAKILWAFEIKRPVDENGKEIELDVSDEGYMDGRFTVPKPYRLRFIPRSPEIEKIVRRDWAEADKGDTMITE